MAKSKTAVKAKAAPASKDKEKAKARAAHKDKAEAKEKEPLQSTDYIQYAREVLFWHAEYVRWHFLSHYNDEAVRLDIVLKKLNEYKDPELGKDTLRYLINARAVQEAGAPAKYDKIINNLPPNIYELLSWVTGVAALYGYYPDDLIKHVDPSDTIKHILKYDTTPEAPYSFAVDFESRNRVILNAALHGIEYDGEPELIEELKKHEVSLGKPTLELDYDLQKTRNESENRVRGHQIFVKTLLQEEISEEQMQKYAKSIKQVGGESYHASSKLGRAVGLLLLMWQLCNRDKEPQEAVDWLRNESEMAKDTSFGDILHKLEDGTILRWRRLTIKCIVAKKVLSFS